MFLLNNTGIEIVFDEGFHQFIIQPGNGAGEDWGRSSVPPPVFNKAGLQLNNPRINLILKTYWKINHLASAAWLNISSINKTQASNYSWTHQPSWPIPNQFILPKSVSDLHIHPHQLYGPSNRDLTCAAAFVSSAVFLIALLLHCCNLSLQSSVVSFSISTCDHDIPLPDDLQYFLSGVKVKFKI